MYPKNNDDFSIIEPLGDLLFFPPREIYYLDEKDGYDGYVDAVSIKKIDNPNFLKSMDGYFSNGEYHISFKMGESVTLWGDDFNKMWGFDKRKLKEYARSPKGLRYSGPIKDETDL